MYEPFKQTNESLLTISTWKQMDERIIAGFTTRRDGYSTGDYESFNLGLHVSDQKEIVVRNRKKLANQLGISLQNWVFTEQVHRSQVMIVDEQHRSLGSQSFSDAISETDGLVTQTEGLVCAQLFADCVPVFFYDYETRTVGIAHSGWKGTVAQIVGNVIQQFELLKAKKENILVVIGPSIQKRNYEVSFDVIRHIDKAFAEHVVEKCSNGRYLLDLPKLIKLSLIQLGIKAQNIARSNYCTYEEQSLFFSHRRDKGITGRMLGFIAIQP